MLIYYGIYSILIPIQGGIFEIWLYVRVTTMEQVVLDSRWQTQEVLPHNLVVYSVSQFFN